MIRILGVILFFVLTIPMGIYAQQEKIIDSVQGQVVLSVCEKMPEFKGGDEARIKYLTENIYYPTLKENEEWQSTVYLSCIIDTNGKIRDIVIIGKTNPDSYTPLEKECVKLVKNMPDWIPGEQEGKKVPVKLNLPIRFEPGQ
jgi:protein TonB